MKGSILPIIVFILLYPAMTFAATDSLPSKYHSLGGRTFGIGIGNSPVYTGLRFNTINRNVVRTNIFDLAISSSDKDSLRTHNGVSITFWKNGLGRSNGFSFGFLTSGAIRQNGLSIGMAAGNGHIGNGIAVGLLASFSEVCNGLSVGSLYNEGTVQNGILIGGFISNVRKINGIGITPFWCCDTARGLIVCFNMGTRRLSPHVYSEYNIVNGMAISFMGAGASRVNGVTISTFNDSDDHHGLSIGLVNHAKKLQGVQIGLFNIVNNNPRGFRRLPFINMHLGKKQYNDSTSTVVNPPIAMRT